MLCRQIHDIIKNVSILFIGMHGSMKQLLNETTVYKVLFFVDWVPIVAIQ